MFSFLLFFSFCSEPFPSRIRSFSSCSSVSDDGIEFSGSPSPSKNKGQTLGTKKCFFGFDNSDEEDSEDDNDDSDDDDDDDWDEYDGEATLIDIPDELKVGFNSEIS